MKLYSYLILLTLCFQTSLFADEKKDKTAGEKPKAAEATKEGGGNTITCVSGADKRVLEVTQNVEGKACKTKYTKGGETSTIAEANAEPGYCATVADKVKKNLETSGFKCE